MSEPTVQEQPVNENEVTKYIVSHLVQDLSALHNGYFSADSDATKRFFTRAIQRMENVITDVKKKLPNGIWS